MSNNNFTSLNKQEIIKYDTPRIIGLEKEINTDQTSPLNSSIHMNKQHNFHRKQISNLSNNAVGINQNTSPFNANDINEYTSQNALYINFISTQREEEYKSHNNSNIIHHNLIPKQNNLNSFTQISKNSQNYQNNKHCYNNNNHNNNSDQTFQDKFKEINQSEKLHGQDKIHEQKIQNDDRNNVNCNKNNGLFNNNSANNIKEYKDQRNNQIQNRCSIIERSIVENSAYRKDSQQISKKSTSTNKQQFKEKKKMSNQKPLPKASFLLSRIYPTNVNMKSTSPQNSPQKKIQTFMIKINSFLKAKQKITSIIKQKYQNLNFKERTFIGDYYDGINEMNNQEEKKQNILTKLIELQFHPHQLFIIIFKIIMLLITIIYILFVPMIIGFEIELNHTMNILNQLCSIAFIVEVAIKFRTSMIDKGEIISHSRLIAMKYLNSDFIFDAISILGFYLLIVDKYFGLLIVFKLQSMMKYMKDLNLHFYLAEKYHQVYTLTRLLCFIFILAHYFACIFHWLALQHSGDPMKKNWIEVMNLQELTWDVRYNYSLYFSFITCITIGYGDISPQNSHERNAVIIFSIISTLCFSFSVNTIGNIFQDIFIKFQKQYLMRYNVINFMNDRVISKDLQLRVLKYLDYINEMERVSPELGLSIIQQISSDLRSEIFEEYYGQILSKNKIFSLYYNEQSRKKMSLKFKEKLFAPGEMIFEQGSQDHNLYFLIKGEIEFFIQNKCGSRNSKNLTIFIQNKQEFFGYRGFISGTSREMSCKSQNISHVFYIKREDFIQILKEDQQDYEQFCKIKDQYNLYTQSLGEMCYSCQSYGHTVINCPRIHLVKNRETMALKYSYSANQERRYIQRQNNLKYQCILNSAQTRQTALSIKKSIIINIFKQYGYNRQIQEEINELEKIHDSDIQKEYPFLKFFDNEMIICNSSDTLFSSSDDENDDEEDYDIYGSSSIDEDEDESKIEENKQKKTETIYEKDESIQNTTQQSNSSKESLQDQNSLDKQNQEENQNKFIKLEMKENNNEDSDKNEQKIQQPNVFMFDLDKIAKTQIEYELDNEKNFRNETTNLQLKEENTNFESINDERDQDDIKLNQENDDDYDKIGGGDDFSIKDFQFIEPQKIKNIQFQELNIGKNQSVQIKNGKELPSQFNNFMKSMHVFKNQKFSQSLYQKKTRFSNSNIENREIENLKQFPIQNILELAEKRRKSKRFSKNIGVERFQKDIMDPRVSTKKHSLFYFDQKNNNNNNELYLQETRNKQKLKTDNFSFLKRQMSKQSVHTLIESKNLLSQRSSSIFKKDKDKDNFSQQNITKLFENQNQLLNSILDTVLLKSQSSNNGNNTSNVSNNNKRQSIFSQLKLSKGIQSSKIILPSPSENNFDNLEKQQQQLDLKKTNQNLMKQKPQTQKTIQYLGDLFIFDFDYLKEFKNYFPHNNITEVCKSINFRYSSRQSNEKIKFKKNQVHKDSFFKNQSVKCTISLNGQ